MADHNNLDLVHGPVELAVKMFTNQQGPIFRQLTGPARPERRELIDGVPVDQILADVEAEIQRRTG